jgi:hypothetical protein
MYRNLLRGVPRKLYRGAQALRSAREESNFEPLLRTDSEAPELLLSPHWDDAVLDCWSLVSSERPLNVANVFAGIPPSGTRGTWEDILGVQDSAQRARARLAEDVAALARGGRTPINLALLDAEHRRGTRHVLGVKDIDRALAAELRSASRVYAPAGIGGHFDHLLVRRYARMLLRAGMPVTLYAELPYCIFHGWPSWVGGTRAAGNRDVDAYWQEFLNAVPELPALRSAEVVRLDESAARAKCDALSNYEASLNYAVRQLLADPGFHGLEVRWELIGQQGDARGTGGARAPEGGDTRSPRAG